MFVVLAGLAATENADRWKMSAATNGDHNRFAVAVFAVVAMALMLTAVLTRTGPYIVCSGSVAALRDSPRFFRLGNLLC